MKITIDIPDPYDNPCTRCMNNPMNNPHASGTCCCSLPDMYMKRTTINSDRWMYTPTVTTSTMRDATAEEEQSVTDYIRSISTSTGVNFWDLSTSDSSMFNTTTTTYSSGGPIVSVEAPKFTGDVAYIN